MISKEKRERYEREERVLFYVLMIVVPILIALALLAPVVIGIIQYQADIQACVRILGLDEAYCADYLRIIRE